MDTREQEMKNNWGPIKSQPDEDLKQIAKDIYNGLIFTDRHCGNNDVMSCFMILMFMGPKPPSEPQYPSDNKDVQGKRDNVLFDLVERDALQAKYEEDRVWYEIEHEYYRENMLKSIGLVYEYLDKAGPRGINGMPNFFSCRLLNQDDAKKMFEYYEKYKEIRQTADNF